MASSWRDILPKVLAEREAVAVSDVSAVSTPETGHNVPNRTNCTNCTLPAELSAGLASLDGGRCPIRGKSSEWAAVVSDAKRLAEDGWASQALALGWTALDLYGSVPDPAGDPGADGLAVKLAGRRVLAISGKFATVENGPSARLFIYRRTNEGARLLWALGRGR